MVQRYAYSVHEILYSAIFTYDIMDTWSDH